MVIKISRYRNKIVEFRRSVCSRRSVETFLIRFKIFEIQNSGRIFFFLKKIKFSSFDWKKGVGGERKCDLRLAGRETKTRKDGRIVIIELRSRIRFIGKKAYLRDHNYLPETGGRFTMLVRFTISFFNS